MAFEWTELTYQQILAGHRAIFIFPLCLLLVFLVLPIIMIVVVSFWGATEFGHLVDLLNQVDLVENIRPSIAIEQSNSVKTSRSTVGTMTDLTEFFKVWFGHQAELFDPETGEKVTDDSPQSIWRKTLKAYRERQVLLAFKVTKPEQLEWAEVIGPLQAQGYARVVIEPGDIRRIDTLDTEPPKGATLWVVQDRLKIESRQRARFLEAATTALHFGQGELYLLDEQGGGLDQFAEGLAPDLEVGIAVEGRAGGRQQNNGLR